MEYIKNIIVIKSISSFKLKILNLFAWIFFPLSGSFTVRTAKENYYFQTFKK